MITLKDLKECKDEYCTKFMLKTVDLIKKQLKLKPNARVFILHHWSGSGYYYFLHENKVYIAGISSKNDGVTITSLYAATIDNETIVDFETVIPDKETNYILEDFKIWYNSPSCVNEFVDIPYSKAIEFLRNYRKTTFKTDRYLFYVKRDKDLSKCFFIHAKDLKTGADLKIYVDSFIQTTFPEKYKEVFIEDLSGKLSKYQLRQCKNEFMSFCKETCKELNAENFYALELVKQCIQPIETERSWSMLPVFIGELEFENITVDDYLAYNKEPYFIVSDDKALYGHITKVAVLDFYKAEYKSRNPHVTGCFKRNHWEMDKNTLKQLTRFLNEPFDFSKSLYAKRRSKEDFDLDDIKTNWQWLIVQFNENSTQELPLNLPVPDYTKLKV